jgi:hypothetical protein
MISFNDDLVLKGFEIKASVVFMHTEKVLHKLMHNSF